MPTAQQNRVRAEKVREAASREIKYLHGSPGSDKPIRALSQLIDCDDSTLARFADILRNYDSKAEAVRHLNEGMAEA